MTSHQTLPDTNLSAQIGDKGKAGVFQRTGAFLKKQFERKVPAEGLSFFRFFYCIALLLEVHELYNFRHIIYDDIPYLHTGEISSAVALYIWMAIIICIMFGWLTRYLTVANYLLTVVLIGTTHDFEYHVFYSYLAVNFAFIFIPISNGISLDAWIAKKQGNPLPGYVSRLEHLLPVLLGAGFIYMNSVYLKLQSPMWMSGLGIWMPCSIPFATFGRNQWILNQEYLMYAGSIATMVYEGAFVIAMWFKRLRLPLFVLGWGLHIGIYYMFPIPYFALTYLAMLLLLLPASWPRLIGLKAFSEKEVGGTKVGIFSRQRMFVFYTVLFAYGFLQLTVDVQTGIMFPAYQKLTSNRIGSPIHQANVLSKDPKRIFFGITQHNVFLDYHFYHYNHAIGVIYNGPGGDKWLPITNPNGTPGDYMVGFTWAKWCFRSNSNANLNYTKLNDGLARFTSKFLYDNNIYLQDSSHFTVVAMPVKLPTHYEPDFLSKAQQTKWKKVGTLTWKDQEYKSDIINIEAHYPMNPEDSMKARQNGLL